jgi:hypothetical protein
MVSPGIAMKTMIPIFVALSWPILGHTEEPQEQKFSKEANKTAQELREKIREEIKAVGKHPWAGEYFLGGGLGVRVCLHRLTGNAPLTPRLP